MKPPHLLLAGGNVRRVKENLVNTVDAAAIQAIEADIRKNVSQLFALGTSHYNFAVRQPERCWRQRVSRLYYGACNVSRAVRLFVNGEFCTDATDHKKIAALPDDFPNKSTHANKLTALREDRNLCDYDHTGTRSDLMLGVADSAGVVADFIKNAEQYFHQKGFMI